MGSKRLIDLSWSVLAHKIAVVPVNSGGPTPQLCAMVDTFFRDIALW